MDDAYGNSYFDNNAVQMTGNCWAHGYINNMLATKAGKPYINNLIVRTDDKITVYLPEAKKDGLPKPKGDGLFTYTPAQISDNIMKESAGDGDYTAFMMAVTDYRKMISGNNQATSAHGGMSLFNHLVFGNDKGDIDNVDFVNQNSLTLKSKKGMFKKFKKLFEAGKGYFDIHTDKSDVMSNHEYSVVKVNDNRGLAKHLQYPLQYLSLFCEYFNLILYLFVTSCHL